MAPSCASSVPPLIGDYPRCRAAAWQAAPTLPLGLSVAAASLSTEASLPLDMPGGREGLEGATDAQGSARRRSGLAHTSMLRVATPHFPDSKSSLGPINALGDGGIGSTSSRKFDLIDACTASATSASLDA